MATRPKFSLILAAAALLLGGCGGDDDGPISVTAIGAPPRPVNPNLQAIDAPAGVLMEATAQGLVRFNAEGEIEPALAQSWIVSDDGLRYTFRIRRTQWLGGGPVTAQEVAARLRAALSRASRNPLKPVLGAIADVVPMTDSVLEISLRGPRPNFLQLLAQPEMAILQGGRGTGPYRLAETGIAGARLVIQRGEDEAGPDSPDILLRGEGAAAAVARFSMQRTDLVIGGTIGDLAFVRATDIASSRLVFDPVSGLFGLAFANNGGPLADPEVRRALAMAVDRDSLVAALGVPRLAPRTSLAPAGLGELAAPAQPDWAAQPLPARRETAARTIAGLGQEAPLRLRVAIPDGPGYRLVFAHLRRDWRIVGVEAERVRPGQPAELRLIDAIAPANLASWYLRPFGCDLSPVCDTAADQALLAARLAPRPAERNAQFAAADRIFAELTPFIPLTGPVRWSLVAQRLRGFRANPFARHPAGELIARQE
ncbi:MAG TPA: ABC transporter substrate-binding protein [Allosphingosinicella sp.]|nr:ABC transporter substrate-binding protein [Allosphingosinicella sp.]